MSTTFQNAPLIELIAELRWDLGPGKAQSNIGPIQFHLDGPQSQDEFFMRFGTECALAGHPSSERVVPEGFPFLAGQPVYRFRPEEGAANTLLQIGAGVFTANAVPPYHSWHEFQPTVASGVAALLKTRNDPEKNTPFAVCSLRYINAFGEELAEGRSPGQFLREVLGFHINMPASVTHLVRDGFDAKPFLQVVLPMANSMKLSLNIGEAQVNGKHAVIMDVTVASEVPVAANLASVMEAFLKARTVIHELFLSVTAPVHGLMQPKGE